MKPLLAALAVVAAFAPAPAASAIPPLCDRIECPDVCLTDCLCPRECVPPPPCIRTTDFEINCP
ncbi:MAG TPA: hypothetical protein VF519_12970 [Mycobacteriales bacterium]